MKLLHSLHSIFFFQRETNFYHAKKICDRYGKKKQILDNNINFSLKLCDRYLSVSYFIINDRNLCNSHLLILITSSSISDFNRKPKSRRSLVFHQTRYWKKGNPRGVYKLKSNIIFFHQSINSFFNIDKVICEIGQALFLSETFHLFASFTTRLYYMTSIVLIESSCSKRYCWRDGKMPSITFYSSSAPRFDSFFAASRKNTADCRPKKNFLAIMLRSTDHIGWVQVPGKIFKRLREVDLRTTRYKVRSSTKLFSSKFFLSFREYFYLPLSYAQKWD